MPRRNVDDVTRGTRAFARFIVWPRRYRFRRPWQRFERGHQSIALAGKRRANVLDFSKGLSRGNEEGRFLPTDDRPLAREVDIEHHPTWDFHLCGP
jgi:hypothetical protein